MSEYLCRMLRGMMREDRDALRHELFGELTVLYGYVQYCRMELSGEDLRKVKAIAEVLQSLMGDTEEMLNTDDSQIRIRRAHDITGMVGKVKQFFPFAPRVKNSFDDEFLHLMDAAAVLVMNSYEAHFSPSQQHDLGADIRRFWMEYSIAKTPVRMLPPRMPPFPTKDDYFANAVFPLIKNVIRHAYPVPDEQSRFSVYGRARDDDLIVRIRDYGRGVDPAVREHLFEEGVSTQQDDGQKHGIGLWAVKRYVENRGGSITCLDPAVGACFRLRIRKDT